VTHSTFSSQTSRERRVAFKTSVNMPSGLGSRTFCHFPFLSLNGWPLA
jgi:hypothetical protein